MGGKATAALVTKFFRPEVDLFLLLAVATQALSLTFNEDIRPGTGNTG
jgi:hypothetical protein